MYLVKLTKPYQHQLRAAWPKRLQYSVQHQTRRFYIDPEHVTNYYVPFKFLPATPPPPPLPKIPRKEIAHTNSILEFYKGSNVFITGVTGFVGKILLEKLLRSCTGIANIYVLIRPKRGESGQQRLNNLFQTIIFDGLRKDNPSCFDKVHVINGDVGETNLGLSERDRQLIKDKVNIVLHSAASVKFNEDLQTILIQNAFGTKQIAELCMGTKNLKSFVYVSTAYSNPDKPHVEEVVYKLSCNPESILKSIETLPADTFMLKQKPNTMHPNNYTFSKAVTESLVANYFEKLPISIVRPSIVNSTWKEPIPGWTDNINGFMGICANVALGKTRSLLSDRTANLDLIPVDTVANTIIAAAWHNATFKTNTVRVYNCTSGGLIWTKLGEIMENIFRESPTKFVLDYPSVAYVYNKCLHDLYTTVHYHAMLLLNNKIFTLYTGSYGQRRKGFVYKTYWDDVSFVATRKRTFETETFRSLIEAVEKTRDGKSFAVIDVRPGYGFKWEEYMKTYLLGIIKYVIKDDMTNVPQARIRLNRLYWTKKIIEVTLVCAVLGVILL